VPVGDLRSHGKWWRFLHGLISVSGLMAPIAARNFSSAILVILRGHTSSPFCQSSPDSKPNANQRSHPLCLWVHDQTTHLFAGELISSVPKREGGSLPESPAARVKGMMAEQIINCVLLADRHHGLTEGVRGMLESAFDAVVMVADEASLFESAARLQPTVAVVDLSLARGESLQWVPRLRVRCPGLKLIVLSVHDQPSVCRSALEAGADAFVLKRAIATDLLPAIDAVQSGQTYVSPGVVESPPAV
jgi:two-component system secretion response regulator SsrB